MSAHPNASPSHTSQPRHYVEAFALLSQCIYVVTLNVSSITLMLCVQAFAFLSWPGGIIYLTICLASSLYSFWLLGHMHEDAEEGVRYTRYRALGKRALGAAALLTPLWFGVHVKPWPQSVTQHGGI